MQTSIASRPLIGWKQERYEEVMIRFLDYDYPPMAVKLFRLLYDILQQQGSRRKPFLFWIVGLAKILGCDRRTVKKYITLLEKDGWLTWIQDIDGCVKKPPALVYLHEPEGVVKQQIMSAVGTTINTFSYNVHTRVQNDNNNKNNKDDISIINTINNVEKEEEVLKTELPLPVSQAVEGIVDSSQTFSQENVQNELILEQPYPLISKEAEGFYSEPPKLLDNLTILKEESNGLLQRITDSKGMSPMERAIAGVPIVMSIERINGFLKGKHELGEHYELIRPYFADEQLLEFYFILEKEVINSWRCTRRKRTKRKMDFQGQALKCLSNTVKSMTDINYAQYFDLNHVLYNYRHEHEILNRRDLSLLSHYLNVNYKGREGTPDRKDRQKNVGPEWFRDMVLKKELIIKDGEYVKTTAEERWRL